MFIFAENAKQHAICCMGKHYENFIELRIKTTLKEQSNFLVYSCRIITYCNSMTDGHVTSATALCSLRLHPNTLFSTNILKANFDVKFRM